MLSGMSQRMWWAEQQAEDWEMPVPQAFAKKEDGLASHVVLRAAVDHRRLAILESEG